MIKVFGSTDKDFRTNGDAVIKASRAVVHKVDNGDFYLSIEAPIDYVDYLKDNNLIVVDTPQGAQAFRIQAPVETTRTKVKIKALHVFYDSANYLIADSYVVNKNCNDALIHLNNATDNTSPFNVYSDIATVDSYRCVRKSLTEAITTVLERWGGHLVRDNFNISILNEIGRDNGVVIQYKKNLKNITVSTDWTGVVTKLLPVGKEGFTLPGLYVFSDKQYEIPFTKTITFNQSIDARDYPDEASYIEALRVDLLTQARKYLESAQYPAITYEIKANVEKITDVGDIVAVIDDRLGVELTARVVSFDYDVILGQYTTISLGTIAPSLSNLLSSVNKTVESSVERSTQALYSYIQSEVDGSEGKIYELLTGSYCIFSGNAISIIDRLPANQAVNVIRLDRSGISISHSGLTGNYLPIITINGAFDADSLEILNFTLDKLTGGTLSIGGDDNELGVISVKNENGDVIGTIDNEGFTSQGLKLDDLIYIGSQVILTRGDSLSPGTTKPIGTFNADLIKGIFTGVNIPSAYERAYRITAQISTNNSNYGAIGLNNFKSSRVRTWSDDSLTGVAGSNYFKESSITLETVVNRSSNGINLYLYNEGSVGSVIYNDVTIHGYLVKRTTTLPTTALPDLDISGGEPQYIDKIITAENGYALTTEDGKTITTR